ncbi:hypothetical protein GCM10010319_01310 [Streptomyces blastmyceticus]|uniref:Uncharacterized protein n=1 Tax=Streptomyces blastmyceticus TaxID=68180 RepID=A0ABN0W8M7_9ACTN
MAAGTLQLATSTSAEATPAQCDSYLQAKGYNVGPKVNAACSMANGGGFWDTDIESCKFNLIGLGVRPEHAKFACEY